MTLGRLCVGMVAVALTASPVVAAPSSCNLVVDPRGDATIDGVPSYSSPNLDIIGADFVSDRSRLTAMIRLNSLEQVDPTAPGGLRFHVDFLVDRAEFQLHAQRSPEGTLFELWVLTGGKTEGNGAAFHGRLAIIDGDFDDDRSTVRIHAPLTAFRPHARMAPGDRIRQPEIWSYRFVGNRGVFEPGRGYVSTGGSSDSASSKGSYPLGTPTCVKVSG